MIKKYIILWLTRCILKILKNEEKTLFRNIERNKIKLIKAEEHIKFNEQCLQHNLLPTFTNIYIYIYIYKYVFFSYVCTNIGTQHNFYSFFKQIYI